MRAIPRDHRTGPSERSMRTTDGKDISVFVPPAGPTDATRARNTQLHLGRIDESGNCDPSADCAKNRGISSCQFVEKVPGRERRATPSPGVIGRPAHRSCGGMRDRHKTNGAERESFTETREPHMRIPASPEDDTSPPWCTRGCNHQTCLILTHAGCAGRR